MKYETIDGRMYDLSNLNPKERDIFYYLLAEFKINKDDEVFDSITIKYLNNNLKIQSIDKISHVLYSIQSDLYYRLLLGSKNIFVTPKHNSNYNNYIN